MPFLLFVSVVQEEVLPSNPARGWLLQSELLQRREDLQRAQRNHFLGLLYGCGSGTLIFQSSLSQRQRLLNCDEPLSALPNGISRWCCGNTGRDLTGSLVEIKTDVATTSLQFPMYFPTCRVKCKLY